MRIGLHDAEKEYFKRGKSFPNLALMKISAYHKRAGDTVEWWNPLIRYDRVYSSKVFDFTPVDPYLPENTIRGGTGYRDIPMDRELDPVIDAIYPDYTIYPECDYAIGYLTRGCPNHCRWCVVPEKEGAIRPYRDWREIVRLDTDKLVLMDNNILACDYGIEQLESLVGSGYRIDLNQGMDASLQGDCLSERARKSPDLAADARMYHTPTAQDAKNSTLPQSQINRDSLVGDVMREMFATPQARDYRTGQASRWEDKRRSRNLNDQIAMFPTPTTGAGLCGGTGNYQQLQRLEEEGVITETERKNMSQGNGGQLNPFWVEWLMGLPVGWTEI